MFVVGWIRRHLVQVVAITVLATTFLIARLPEATAADRREMAAQYKFAPLSISIPGGYPQQTIRRVNQDYERIRAWISSVGAGIAMNDIDGDGLSNDLCLTDVRIDRVVVAPTPGLGEARFSSFALDPAPLPMNPHIAPMGCVPGDFNEDGRTDLLVYWWGRTPVLFLARAGTDRLSARSFEPVELVPNPSAGGRYDGAQWNTNTAAVADFDGDGHDDIFVGNYFPDGPVLDDTVRGGVVMTRSLSVAYNGGENRILRWTGGRAAGAKLAPSASFADAGAVFSDEVSRGWTLAAAATDLDGDRLPELYVANDFGPDRLLHNRSTPGRVRLALVDAADRGAFTPKSKRIGHDSFKGMGVDFGDLNADGVNDIYVGNITTSFGIQESNFAFVSATGDPERIRRGLNAGRAEWADRSAPLGLAWSGWSWDVKFGDFVNSGEPAIVQTAGFVKGDVNRWAQLQELATANDGLVEHPFWWPTVRQGDDIAGGQHLAFHVRGAGGRYEDVSGELGLDIPIPTRGIATGDADGDGRLDFAVARQWDAPVFYHNESPSPGRFLGLRLTHDTGAAAGVAASAGSAVVDAQVRVALPDGRTLLGRVDGGSGHSGKRSFEVHFGLGQADGPVRVQLVWRDRSGTVRQDDLQLSPGWHAVKLGSEAREVTS